MTEYIDIYTKDHIRTGRRVPRTAHLKIGEYRLIVHVCLFNAENKMLIQKRSSRKTSFGLLLIVAGTVAMTAFA